MQVEELLYKPDGSMDVTRLRRELGQHLEDVSALLAQDLLQEGTADDDDDDALSDGERELLHQREAFLGVCRFSKNALVSVFTYQKYPLECLAINEAFLGVKILEKCPL
jgi:hypothetical protein